MPRTQGNRRGAALFALAALVATAAVASTGCNRDGTASPQSDAVASAQTVPPKSADMRTVTVPVNGMICMVCAGSVKNALKAVHGVENAEVHLEKRFATVQYENGKVSVDELTRVISQLGYKVGVPRLVQSQ